MIEKYGTVTINNILFKDKKEFDSFVEWFMKNYGLYISKVNGQRTMKLIKTQEQKRHLASLNLEVMSKEGSNTLSMKGFGHRNCIFGLESKLRELFDQYKIVTYDISDTISRSAEIEPTISERIEGYSEFHHENKRRIELFIKGEFPEAIHSEETKVYKK